MPEDQRTIVVSADLPLNVVSNRLFTIGKEPSFPMTSLNVYLNYISDGTFRSSSQESTTLQRSGNFKASSGSSTITPATD